MRPQLALSNPEFANIHVSFSLAGRRILCKVCDIQCKTTSLDTRAPSRSHLDHTGSSRGVLWMHRIRKLATGERTDAGQADTNRDPNRAANTRLWDPPSCLGLILIQGTKHMHETISRLRDRHYAGERQSLGGAAIGMFVMSMHPHPHLSLSFPAVLSSTTPPAMTTPVLSFWIRSMSIPPFSNPEIPKVSVLNPLFVLSHQT